MGRRLVDSYRLLFTVGMASTAYGAFLLVQVRCASLCFDMSGDMGADGRTSFDWVLCDGSVCRARSSRGSKRGVFEQCIRCLSIAKYSRC